jgi:hypothetical protein
VVVGGAIRNGINMTNPDVQTSASFAFGAAPALVFRGCGHVLLERSHNFIVYSNASGVVLPASLQGSAVRLDFAADGEIYAAFSNNPGVGVTGTVTVTRWF